MDTTQVSILNEVANSQVVWSILCIALAIFVLKSSNNRESRLRNELDTSNKANLMLLEKLKKSDDANEILLRELKSLSNSQEMIVNTVNEMSIRLKDIEKLFYKGV